MEAAQEQGDQRGGCLISGKVGDGLRIEVLRMTGSLCLGLGGVKARGETGSAERGMAQFETFEVSVGNPAGVAQGTVRKGQGSGPEVSFGGGAGVLT